MSPETIGLLLMIAFLIVLIIGLPISFSMLLIGAVGIAIYTSPAVALDSVSLNLLEQFGNFNYLVIPMYMFMGYLAAESGLGQKFFNTANKWIGHLPGGLAMAAQAACAVAGWPWLLRPPVQCLVPLAAVFLRRRWPSARSPYRK